MNDYKLIMRTYNTYDQISIETVIGKNKSANEFLERCFQCIENEISDPNLNITIEEPDNFSQAGGFSGDKENWNLFENKIEIPDILNNFPW